MPMLLSTEDGRVSKAEWVVRWVYVYGVYYQCLMPMLLSTEDGRVSKAEWVVRWVCAYGDTGDFARFLWERNFQDATSVNATMAATPPFGQNCNSNHSFPCQFSVKAVQPRILRNTTTETLFHLLLI